MTDPPVKRPARPRRAAAAKTSPAEPVLVAVPAEPEAGPPPAPAEPAAAVAEPAVVADVKPAPPITLAIDVGGSGLKATVFDTDGTQIGARVRVPTTYPLPPEALVGALTALVQPLPPYDRVSVGFPGVVRDGRVLSAPHFVTVAGPGTKVSPPLQAGWQGFDLAGALEQALGKPTRVANDADVQGSAVVRGEGVEMVVTLGTGVGTALFSAGVLAPHLELAHHPLRKGKTYNEYLGDAARKKIGSKKWNRRVRRLVATLDALVFFDHLYIGGGNSSKLTGDLGSRVTVVDNTAGLLGGIKLWERHR